MNKLARILLVEPEPLLRCSLDWHLDQAGHEVTAVADTEAARDLVAEGLLPDIVVFDVGKPDTASELRGILPHAAHLPIVRQNDGDSAASPDAASDPEACPADPGEILRRIEEVLFHFEPFSGEDDASRCMDLARRLANSLPRTRTSEERIDLVTEGFHAFFRVKGTLVVRRGPGHDEWIEVCQGLPDDLAERVSEQIARRTQLRGLRPFLAGLEVDGTVHQVACLPIQVGGVETDLAMALETAPALPAHRESLMSLVGGAIRSAMNEESADTTRDLLEAQVSSFESLLSMSREFTAVHNRAELGRTVLGALHRELQMTRSALFIARDQGSGMLDLQGARGFPEAVLERIGLSAFHGVGEQCLRASEPTRLSTFPPDGLAARELRLLGEASLRWAVPFRIGDRPLGVLFFGSPDEHDNLLPADRQVLQALLEAASVALRGLERMEALQDVAVRTLKGLVSAIELHCPQERGHAERVARSAVQMGRALKLGESELRDLAIAALLHDVGKVSLAAPLAEGDESVNTERRVRAHPVVGSRILSRAKPAAGVVQAVEQHHERWDGLGFPYGLQQDAIQLFARIVAIANAYDHARFQEGPTSPDDALRMLERGAGLLFDPGLVALFADQVVRGTAADWATRDDGHDGDGWLEDVLAAG